MAKGKITAFRKGGPEGWEGCPGCAAAGCKEPFHNLCAWEQGERGIFVHCHRAGPEHDSPSLQYQGDGKLECNAFFVPVGDRSQLQVEERREEKAAPALCKELSRKLIDNYLRLAEKHATHWREPCKSFLAKKGVDVAGVVTAFDDGHPWQRKASLVEQGFMPAPTAEETRAILDGMLSAHGERLEELTDEQADELPFSRPNKRKSGTYGIRPAPPYGAVDEFCLDADGYVVAWLRRWLQGKKERNWCGAHRLHHELGCFDRAKNSGKLLLAESIRKARVAADKLSVGALGLPSVNIGARVIEELKAAFQRAAKEGVCRLVFAPDFADLAAGHREVCRAVEKTWKASLADYAEKCGLEVRWLAWDPALGKGVDDALLVGALLEELDWQDYRSRWGGDFAFEEEAPVAPAKIHKPDSDCLFCELVTNKEAAYLASKKAAKLWKLRKWPYVFCGYPGIGKDESMMRRFAKKLSTGEVELVIHVVNERATAREMSERYKDLGVDTRLALGASDEIGLGTYCNAIHEKRTYSELRQSFCKGCPFYDKNCGEITPGVSGYRATRDEIKERVKVARKHKREDRQPLVIVTTYALLPWLMRLLPSKRRPFFVILSDVDARGWLGSIENLQRDDIDAAREGLEEHVGKARDLAALETFLEEQLGKHETILKLEQKRDRLRRKAKSDDGTAYWSIPEAECQLKAAKEGFDLAVMAEAIGILVADLLSKFWNIVARPDRATQRETKKSKIRKKEESLDRLIENMQPSLRRAIEGAFVGLCKRDYSYPWEQNLFTVENDLVPNFSALALDIIRSMIAGHRPTIWREGEMLKISAPSLPLISLAKRGYVCWLNVHKPPQLMRSELGIHFAQIDAKPKKLELVLIDDLDFGTPTKEVMIKGKRRRLPLTKQERLDNDRGPDRDVRRFVDAVRAREPSFGFIGHQTDVDRLDPEGEHRDELRYHGNQTTATNTWSSKDHLVVRQAKPREEDVDLAARCLYRALGLDVPDSLDKEWETISLGKRAGGKHKGMRSPCDPVAAELLEFYLDHMMTNAVGRCRALQAETTKKVELLSKITPAGLIPTRQVCFDQYAKSEGLELRTGRRRQGESALNEKRKMVADERALMVAEILKRDSSSTDREISTELGLPLGSISSLRKRACENGHFNSHIPIDILLECASCSVHHAFLKGLRTADIAAMVKGEILTRKVASRLWNGLLEGLELGRVSNIRRETVKRCIPILKEIRRRWWRIDPLDRFEMKREPAQEGLMAKTDQYFVKRLGKPLRVKLLEISLKEGTVTHEQLAAYRQLRKLTQPRTGQPCKIKSQGEPNPPLQIPQDPEPPDDPNADPTGPGE